MLTDRSFVLAVPAELESLRLLRHELAQRLPASHLDDEVLLVAALLCRQTQSWHGGTGPVRLRASILGQVVHVEVNRDVEDIIDAGPLSPESFHGLLEVLVERTDRFTVSTFPGMVSFAAQRIVDPLPSEAEIDLRVAA